MRNRLTAQDVLTDIDFELALGAISRDELGQGIQQVKQYQNKLRHDVLQSDKGMPQMQEIIGRQFQLNDMLIVIVQEMAANAREMEQRTERLREVGLYNTPDMSQKTAVFPPNDIEPVEHWRDTTPLKQIAEHTLQLKLDIQPSHTPIIGNFLGRLKRTIHELILFYVNKMGAEQTTINHTTSNWMLYLEEQQNHHHRDMQKMWAQIADLQSKIDGESK